MINFVKATDDFKPFFEGAGSVFMQYEAGDLIIARNGVVWEYDNTSVSSDEDGWYKKTDEEFFFAKNPGRRCDVVFNAAIHAGPWKDDETE